MSIKNNKGITLIALVITIIVLLILAGVTINMVLDEDGIIAQATHAKEVHEEAERQDAIGRAILALRIGEDGKIVEGIDEEKLEAELGKTLGKDYEIDEDAIVKNEETGKIEVTITKGNEMYTYEISANGEVTKTGNTTGDLNGTPTPELTPEPTPSNPYIAEYINEVPVPKGFVYVGGTKDTGLIISDNVEDANKGETETNSLKGNQFVWVPVSPSSSFPTLSPGYSDGAKQDWIGTDGTVSGFKLTLMGNITEAEYVKEYTDMLESVEEYGGFYVGRYETNNSYGSTAGAIPISNVDWYTMYNGQKGLYNNENDSVVSGMIYGCQWDAIMDWTKDVPNNDTSITDATQKFYIKNSTGMGWYSGVAGNSTHLTGKDLLAEDGTVLNKVKNIYDLAGNMYERTQEAYGTVGRVYRGGSCDYDGSYYPASFRDSVYLPGSASDNSSSRLQLYIRVAL